MQQPVFAARGHDAVRLLRALRDEVVDESADVAVRAFKHQRHAPEQLQRGVHARHKALHGRLLIAGRAVELARAVEAGQLFALERRGKLRRVDAVIFDGVGRAQHFGVLQPRDGVQHGKLHLLRQARGQALQVQLVRPEAARLQEELVARLVGEADDLRLDARAVARADAGDGAVEQRAAVQILADDGVRALVRPRQPAHGLIFRRLTGGKRERLRIVVAALDLHFREIDAARVDARGRSGLEPAHP